MSLLLLAAVIAQPAVAENVWTVHVAAIEANGSAWFVCWDTEWGQCNARRANAKGEIEECHESRWLLMYRGRFGAETSWLYRDGKRWLLWVPSQGLLIDADECFATNGYADGVRDASRLILER